MRNDVKRGREAAARYLTRRHRTQRYRAKHIKDKICRLWKTLGREDSSSVDEIYEDGVNRRTLPGLTSEEFQSIKAEIDAMKMRHPQWAKLQKPLHPRTTYADRRLRLSPEVGEISCICPFDTDDGGHSVQCNKCGTWQHIYCYYENDKGDVPDSHVCRKCETGRDVEMERRDNTCISVQSTSSVDGLSSAEPSDKDEVSQNASARIRELEEQIQYLRQLNDDKLNRMRRLEQDLDSVRDLGSFTTFRDYDWKRNLDCAPNDDRISEEMAHVGMDIHRIVLGMPFKAKELDKRFLNDIEEIYPDLYHHLRLCFGSGLTVALAKAKGKRSSKPLGTRQVLRAAISTAIDGWVFGASLPNLNETELSLFKAQSQCIFSQDGYGALRNLHQATWYRLTQIESNAFEKTIAGEAENLTKRLFDMVIPLLLNDSPEESKDDDRLFRDWDARRSALSELFKKCHKLRAELVFRQEHFEFYRPKSGTRFDPLTMQADQNQGTVSGRAKVSLCLFPAVLVYPTLKLGEEDGDADKLNGFWDCISRQDGERGDGTVILKATVLLQ